MAILILTLSGLGLLSVIIFIFFTTQNVGNFRSVSENRLTGEQVEHPEGTSWKWPWAKIIKEVDMTSSIIISNAGVFKLEEFKMKDLPQSLYEVKSSIDDGGAMVMRGRWYASIQPQPGQLITFIKRTKETAITELIAHIELSLCDELSKKTQDHWSGNKKEAAEFLSGLFLGEKVQSSMEKKNGIRISDPLLANLDMDSVSSKATQDQYVSFAFQKAVAAYRKDHPEITEEAARRAVLITTGKTDSKMYGLENAKEIAEALGSFFKK